MFTAQKFSLQPVEPETKSLFPKWWQDSEIRNLQDSSLFPVATETCELNFERWFLPDSTSQIGFQIMTPDLKKVIGITNFRSIDWLNRSAEYTILIGDKSYWNQGIGKEVTKMMINLAFNEYNLHRIMLRVYSHNDRAIHVYKKTGFEEEGRLRHTLYRHGTWYDTVMMSMLDPN